MTSQSPTPRSSIELIVPPDLSSEAMLRTARIALICILVGIGGGLVAQLLRALIGFFTNLAFYHRMSLRAVEPWDNTMGLAVIAVPVIGAFIGSLLARYGSPAIRGHGIPETMEQVLTNESRIKPRITLLKPLSAAIAIGTGGPFGAEGPIIATGGALGSLLGQLLRITADERKIFLAAGAAAGMSATFGAPVSAVLLAVELLLFEYRPRSLIPVALASAAAQAVRLAFHGFNPIFAVPDLTPPSGWALALYVLLGAFMGLVAVGITRVLYAVEDAFDRLPVHWMWWPLMGGAVIGVTGWLAPRTLGVGYANIADALGGSLAGKTLVVLLVLKFISWVISLGSGMSGGTMAPLFTFGSGLGALIGAGLIAVFPGAGINISVAGMVGMASLFAGASHAVLASAVLAFETTRQPVGLLPLLAGCSGSFLISLLLAPYSLMTEKLARRGRKVTPGYSVDYLDHVLVRDIAGKNPVCLKADQAVEEVRDWIAGRAAGSEHQGFPVLNPAGKLIGVVTRRDLLDLELEMTARVGELIHRAPVVIFDDSTGREAEDHMVRAGVGRLPVVRREEPRKVIGVLTRSDLLMAHSGRLHAANTETRAIGGKSWKEAESGGKGR